MVVSDVMKDLLKKYIEAEREKRRIETELQEVKAKLQELSEQVLNVFELEGLQSLKLEDGVTIALRTDIRANIPADKREEAYEEFKRQGFDGIVKETIHPKTLEAWVREYASINGVELPEWAAPYVEVYEQTRPVILGLK
jgi:hypothetical protein